MGPSPGAAEQYPAISALLGCRPMSQLARGVGDVSRGFAFLNSHPRLWGWVIAPALVTALLLAGLIGLGWRMLSGLVAWMTGYLPDWLHDVASWGLSILLVIGLGAAALLVFVAVAGAIAGPFCELLSEAVEEQLTGKQGPPFSLPQFASDAARGLAHSARRLTIAVLGSLFLFAVSLVPLAGTLVAIGVGGWFAARAAAYDSYDAVLSRRSLAYQAKLDFLKAHQRRSLGLGMTVAAMLLVPGLNLVALGVGAVGATLAAHELAAAPPR
jgi:CysZ protein